MTLRLFLVLCMLLVAPGTAIAGQRLWWESLEWMVDSTPYIVRGKVVDIKRLPSGDDTPLWATEDMVIKISEVLKGDISTEYINAHRLHKVQTSAVQWRMEQSDLVFFLRSTKTPGAFLFQYEAPSAPINLSHLSDNVVLLSNFTVSRDREEILDVIKRRIAQPPVKLPVQKKKERAWLAINIKLPENAEIVAIPAGTEAFRAVCSRAECALMVPADLLELSKKPIGGTLHGKTDQ